VTELPRQQAPKRKRKARTRQRLSEASNESPAVDQARKAAAAIYAQGFKRTVPAGFASIRVHELKHTFGRGLRRTGDGGRQEGPAGSQNGSITSHYSAAELGKLIDEANKISATDSRGPALTILRRKVG